jgi:hypothetical protein
LGVGAAVAMIFGLGWFRFYLPTRHAVDIGAAMLAKQVCSCVFVAGRDVADCRADQFASMDRIQLEVRHDEGRVRAWVPAFGERSATFREDFGCSLE